MLPRAHRVSRGSDIVTAVRKGARVATDHAVVHRLRGSSAEPVRFGFVVSKKVGGAVVRNRVRRRLQAICADHLETASPGDIIVVRALPGSPEVKWDTLRSEINQGLRQVVKAR